MKNGKSITSSSYVDEVGILGSGWTVEESAAAAQRELDCLTKWVDENAILFNAKKPNVAQFAGYKREEPIRITFNGKIIRPAEHVRLLGVHLNL